MYLILTIEIKVLKRLKWFEIDSTKYNIEKSLALGKHEMENYFPQMENYFSLKC